MLYGLLAGTLRLPVALGGPLLGALAWYTGSGWILPRLRELPRPGAQSREKLAADVAFHLAYGLVAAAVFNRLSGGGARLKEIEFEIEFAKDDEDVDDEDDEEDEEDKEGAAA